MLIKLEFATDNDAISTQKGVVFSTREITDAGDFVKAFEGNTIPGHEYWKDWDDPEKSSKILHVLEDNKGVYWGWNIDSCLHYFNHKRKERFPNFDPETGEFYDGKELNEIWNADDTTTHLTSGKKCPNPFGTISSYGVADNIEQVLERYKAVIDSPTTKIIITAAPICKDEQPSDGGWRWHKWGEYIGTQEPQCEYLYDEPSIDEVIIFHVIVVEEK